MTRRKSDDPVERGWSAWDNQRAFDAVMAARKERAADEADCDTESVDPADAMIVSGYRGNFQQYAIDEIWMRNGRVMVAVSLKNRAASDPPDTRIYRMVEGDHAIRFEEVGWVDGTKHEWSEE